MDDQRAIERYRYMLRTAPPDDIERAHVEAFEKLSAEQRQTVLRELAGQVPPSELPANDDPAALARAATRAEMRQPGTLERTFASVPSGPGLGGMFLSTLAGAFVGTAIADAFFSDPGAAGDAGAGGEFADASQAGDAGGSDYGADSTGGDFADFGGDLGGGDLGGGDLGA